MSSQDSSTSRAPKEAQPPVGVNHLVLNVRNLEESHRFWTEIMGFRQDAELNPRPGRPPMKMRFYSCQSWPTASSRTVSSAGTRT